MLEHLEPGGWFFEFNNSFYPDIDDTTMVEMALAACLPGDGHADWHATLVPTGPRSYTPDAELAALGSCDEATGPAQRLGPHVAPLGVKFYTGAMFPAEYRDQLFIAEHGSWNRSEKIGYRISLVRLEGDQPVSYEPFAEGWLKGDDVYGRPVDILIAPDGAMLVSDDQEGVIYRISYVSGSAPAGRPLSLYQSLGDCVAGTNGSGSYQQCRHRRPPRSSCTDPGASGRGMCRRHGNRQHG